jgi:hypothetical protein
VDERLLLLAAGEAARRLQGVRDVQSLPDVEFRVFSQWGEDGIIEWLVQRLPISCKRFVEFGVENYEEANTRLLLMRRNWKGLILDGDRRNIEQVRSRDIYWKHDLLARAAFVTRDNIDHLLCEAGFAGRLGLLSIDIDGNDYWVWSAITAVRPDIVICEYNAVFGDVYPVTVPYDARFRRSASHPSNLYFGASIRALEFLADRKGYQLLGSNLAGCNAFFVRSELFGEISRSVLDRRAKPSLFRESRDQAGRLTYASGLDRLALIGAMPVVRLDTDQVVGLGSLREPYSGEWLAQMGLNGANEGCDHRAATRRHTAELSGAS